MKVLRAPWIRCRADEVGTCEIQVNWRKQTLVLIAYSEREAQVWWGGLRDEERDAAVGLDNAVDAEQTSLW
jgi:hypothetical protein